MVSIPRKSPYNDEMNDGDREGSKISLQNRVIKHPLQDNWTLWYFEFDRSKKNWEDMQNKVTTFDTVEDFWSLYNHIVLPSSIGEGNDYSLFKKNIEPKWEDGANKDGGRWIINFDKTQRRKEIDDVWLDTMLYLIGATSRFADSINGAVVNIRQRGHTRGDKISIWTSDCPNRNTIYGIGEELKNYLGLESKITYEKHITNKSKSESKSMCVL